MTLARHKDTRDMMGEFLLHLSFHVGLVLVAFGVCAILWDFWAEQNNKMFRALERDLSEGPLSFIFLLAFNFQDLL